MLLKKNVILVSYSSLVVFQADSIIVFMQPDTCIILQAGACLYIMIMLYVIWVTKVIFSITVRWCVCLSGCHQTFFKSPLSSYSFSLILMKLWHMSYVANAQKKLWNRFSKFWSKKFFDEFLNFIFGQSLEHQQRRDVMQPAEIRFGCGFYRSKSIGCRCGFVGARLKYNLTHVLF